MKPQTSNFKPQNYFVTGTDTGVGKTLVTALLALHFQSQGVDAGVMKPFATGCRSEDGVLVSDDAELLRDVTGVKDELELINPARWEEPLAPLVAARRAGDTEDHWSRCMTAYKVLCARHEVVIVEGVGGVLVPLQERDGKILTCLDLMSTLALPVIVVARRTLGTINHTLLTVEVLRNANLEIAGVVFCDAEEIAAGDIAAQTSTQVIAKMSGAAILGCMPHLREISRASLKAAAAEIF